MKLRREGEAFARAKMIRTGPRKLNDVAVMIRGLKVEKALAALTFSKKRISKDVKNVLEAAIANAENNHQLDVDRLWVKEAYVGKALLMKRMRPRARGRSGSIQKFFSRLTVIVSQREEVSDGSKG